MQNWLWALIGFDGANEHGRLSRLAGMRGSEFQGLNAAGNSVLSYSAGKRRPTIGNHHQDYNEEENRYE